MFLDYANNSTFTKINDHIFQQMKHQEEVEKLQQAVISISMSIKLFIV